VRWIKLQKQDACVKFELTMKIGKTKLTSVDVEERKKLDFNAGDTVRVWSKVLDEKGKTRLQAFEGIVLARKHGTEIGGTFTVRRVASGVGVERIFPLYSPAIDKIEITKKSRARKSKLYYVRAKAVKDVRRKLRSVVLENEGEIEKVKD
jgi:large subunit ribosomal protein L19